jgi:hypothetical protein
MCAVRSITHNALQALHTVLQSYDDSKYVPRVLYVVVPIHLTEPCFTEYGGDLRHVRWQLREVTVQRAEGAKK